jgi:DMSO/TMAO reductase YedYZ heme-binding membrane subunit
MGNIVVILGIVTYSLFALTILFLILFRVKKKKIFYRLHRTFGIIAISFATVHGTMAALYFLGYI